MAILILFVLGCVAGVLFIIRGVNVLMAADESCAEVTLNVSRLGSRLFGLGIDCVPQGGAPGVSTFPSWVGGWGAIVFGLLLPFLLLGMSLLYGAVAARFSRAFANQYVPPPQREQPFTYRVEDLNLATLPHIPTGPPDDVTQKPRGRRSRPGWKPPELAGKANGVYPVKGRYGDTIYVYWTGDVATHLYQGGSGGLGWFRLDS